MIRSLRPLISILLCLNISSYSTKLDLSTKAQLIIMFAGTCISLSHIMHQAYSTPTLEEFIAYNIVGASRKSQHTPSQLRALFEKKSDLADVKKITNDTKKKHVIFKFIG